MGLVDFSGIFGMRVLCFSAHADDLELGAGGTVHQLVKSGAKVESYVLSLAHAEPGYDRLVECEKAHAALGVTHLELWDYPERRLFAYREEILDRFIALRDGGGVDIVLCPARYDCHQDHQVVTGEALRAFKWSSILGYDLPWNTVGDSHLNYYVALSDADVNAKETSADAYESQLTRSFFAPGALRTIAAFRGGQVSTQFAEGFECIRWIARGRDS
jgi:LmbE family N-acetylglucosaminyl deacetylase